MDIHRKPGYDPLELFTDPERVFSRLQIGWKFFKRQLGMRSLLDVIPLTPPLVKGSHGRPTDDIEQGPVMISSSADKLPLTPVKAESVRDILLHHIFDNK